MSDPPSRALFAAGARHFQAGDYAAAEADLRAVLLQEPADHNALNLLGLACVRQRRTKEGIAFIEKALEVKPDFGEALNSLGSARFTVGNWSGAAEAFQTALKLKPASAVTHFNLGNALGVLGQLDEARDCYGRAFSLNPNFTDALALDVQLSTRMCDWRALGESKEAFLGASKNGTYSGLPFTLLSLIDDPELHLAAAERYCESHGIRALPSPAPKNRRHSKIRVAYLSADFRAHATSHLMLGLFKRHDRSRFHIYGVCYSPDDGSELRAEVLAQFDTHIDARELSDDDVAKRLSEAEIDIAVDLKGHTDLARPMILASRPAAVQISYLGYPGTMGTDFIDYILGDETVLPFDRQRQYREKIVHIPHCYQANNLKDVAQTRAVRRADVGLPETGFVFCCFNSSYKITPKMFRLWMDLLRGVPGSVLWLLADNKWQEANLTAAASAQGISPERLIFAPRASFADHFARHALIDLFLDTFPYNAHTTASDALWAGAPIVTCMGESFASRVSASMLRSMNLPELIAANYDEYKRTALRLALDPEALTSVKNRLAAARLRSPLFDTAGFTRRLEDIYVSLLAKAEAARQ